MCLEEHKSTAGLAVLLQLLMQRQRQCAPHSLLPDAGRWHADGVAAK